MNLTTKYITPSDYLNYFGQNLKHILPDDDSPSNKAERFIKQVEDEVEMFLNERCFKSIDVEWACFSEKQKECYKLALLYQCKYKIENGDISNDSGYDPQTGKIISSQELKDIELSRNTKRYLNICGLWNRNIMGKLSGGGMFPWLR